MSTGTELEVRRQRDMAAAVPAKLEYARALADSGLLPSQYRKNPANVLYAVEYGEMLGLSAMAAITGIHVIEGKPSASAGLISALVRRAGHKLRVWGDARSATCQIVRCDDPDYVFEVTWTRQRNSDGNPSAEEAKLLSKEVWQKYPASMLKARAISQCARDACEEALFGLHYTPEELGAEVDEEGNVVLIDDGRPKLPQDTPAAPAPQVPDGWNVDDAIAAAMNADSLDACRQQWRDASAANKARQCTGEEARRIQDLLSARMEGLREEAAEEAAEARDAQQAPAALDPDDPWAVKVDGISAASDADAVMNELLEEFKAGRIDETRANQVRAAISARASAVADVIEGKVAA